jgi:hypothetical protein
VGGEAPVTPILSLDSSYLNPSYKPCDKKTLRKGFIAKMAYLVELWLILESDLVECASHRIFFE